MENEKKNTKSNRKLYITPLKVVVEIRNTLKERLCPFHDHD